jgi:phasin family protein
MATKPKAASTVNAGQTPSALVNPDAIPADPAAPRAAAKPKTFDKAVAALKQDVEVATGASPAEATPTEHAAPAPQAEPAHVTKSEPIAVLAVARPALPMAEPAAIPAAASAPTPIKQGVTRVMKTAEQLAQFHQGNMEAIVKSSQIWASGLQDLSKHVASNAQATMEETISTFRAMTSVKSLKEAFELQSSFARASMEKAMSESSKLTETGLKLAEQAYAPITARVNAAVEVFTNRG